MRHFKTWTRCGWFASTTAAISGSWRKASSINVRKVLWTCAELDLPFQQENWGTGFQSTADSRFLALNPNAMVPTMQDGDFTFWESNSIIRYLAAT